MVKVLRHICPELSIDPRTILGLPQQMVKKAMGTGKHIHFGLEDCMQQAIEADSRFIGDSEI